MSCTNNNDLFNQLIKESESNRKELLDYINSIAKELKCENATDAVRRTRIEIAFKTALARWGIGKDEIESLGDRLHISDETMKSDANESDVIIAIGWRKIYFLDRKEILQVTHIYEAPVPYDLQITIHNPR